MSFILQTTLELGMMYALVSMALFLSFRVLDIADLPTDGAFVLGMAVSVTMTASGHPFLGLLAAMLSGAAAGFVTAFLQTRLGVPSILAGIVTNTGLYTVNLMAMGWTSNANILKQKTIFTLFRSLGIGGRWYSLIVSIFFLSGLIMLFLGLIGEYLGRLFQNVTSEPQFVVRQFYQGRENNQKEGLNK